MKNQTHALLDLRELRDRFDRLHNTDDVAPVQALDAAIQNAGVTESHVDHSMVDMALSLLTKCRLFEETAYERAAEYAPRWINTDRLRSYFAERLTNRKGFRVESILLDAIDESLERPANLFKDRCSLIQDQELTCDVANDLDALNQAVAASFMPHPYRRSA